MTTQLTVLEKLKPVPFFTKGDDVDDILEKIKKDALLHVPDLSTGKGRAAITANITRVTESKTYLEAKGKELAVEYKSIPAKIDKNRKKVKDFLAELQVELRKPLTEWEEDQAKIKAKKIADDLAEKEAEAKELLHELAIEKNITFDRDLADEKIKLELEAKAEEDQLKQVKIDNDIRIAKEATEEAERLAQEKIDNAKIAEQKAIDDKIKSDNELLASKAREKLLNEQAAAKKLNDEWLVYIAEAYEINDQLIAEAFQKQQQALAEQQRIDAIETERLEGIERQRLAQKKINDDAAEREANTEHNRKVNQAIVKVLVANGITKEDAVKMVILAVQKKLPQLTINY